MYQRELFEAEAGRNTFLLAGKTSKSTKYAKHINHKFSVQRKAATGKLKRHEANRQTETEFSAPIQEGLCL